MVLLSVVVVSGAVSVMRASPIEYVSVADVAEDLGLRYGRVRDCVRRLGIETAVRTKWAKLYNPDIGDRVRAEIEAKEARRRERLKR